MPIIKSVVTSLHTNTLKHVCFRTPSTLDFNDTVTFITLSTPYHRPPTPLVSVTLAFWISPPSFLNAAAIRALTTFVCVQSVSINTCIGNRDVAMCSWPEITSSWPSVLLQFVQHVGLVSRFEPGNVAGYVAPTISVALIWCI